MPLLRLVVFALMLLGPLLGLPAQAQTANPFRVEAVGLEVAAGAEATLDVMVVVPKGYHVYRDMMAVTVTDAGGLTFKDAVFPLGEFTDDPANPGTTREQFKESVRVQLPVTATAAGTHLVTVEVRYQGCKQGLCYMPAAESHTVEIDVRGDAKGALTPSSITPGSLTPSWDDATAWVSSAGGGNDAVRRYHPPAAPAVDLSDTPETASVQKLDPKGKKHPVHARLLVDRDTVKPGEPFRLGVHLQQAEGWHTYWKSPGDIGLPTQIEWSLPEGATHTDFEFPTPIRFEDKGIVSFGYDDQVLFFTEVTLPEGASGPIAVGAEASWLVCEISCIPGAASLSREIGVGDGAASAAAPLFDHFAAQHPIDSMTITGFGVERALSASAVRPEEAFKAALRVVPTGAEIGLLTAQKGYPAFTPIVGENWYLVSSSVEATADGGLSVILEGETFAVDALPESDAVGGLLQVDVGGKIVRTEITLDMPWAAAGADVTPSPSPLFTAATPGAPPGAPPDAPAPTDSPPTAPDAEAGSPGFLSMLGLAFAGGMLLNIMPCVLPVLTLKLYSLVEQVDISTRERQLAGIAYTAGIVASFLVLAGAVLALKASFGAQVGWGFQFQYPAYVAVLAGVGFLCGLSLLGVFAIPALGANQAADAAGREGLVGYFLTGVFATLLATPCSAPFLGTGMGFAFSLPGWGILLFFGVAGLGLAAPFLVIAFVPALVRLLPRPGAWMETFKQLLGFTLIATTVWLVDVLGAQIGRDRLTGFLAFLLVLSVSSWIFGKYGSVIASRKQQAIALLSAAALSAAGGFFFLDLEFSDEPTAAAATDGEMDFTEAIPWQPFSEKAVADLSGKPVFIDFTADWCLTCKANEKTILETETVRGAMARLGIIPLKADWTRRDETITAWLQRYGRAGVPFYLVIPADPSDKPIPLPEVITPGLVLDALEKAAG